MKVTSRFYYGWIIVAVAFLAYLCWGVSRHVLPYVLPTMEAELNLAHGPMGNITSAYFIAYTIMSFVWGIIADRIGPRKCMLIGQVGILIGLAGMGFMSSPIVGFLFYLLCGAGAAGQSVPIVRLLSDWFGRARRGTALGIAMTGSGVSTVVLGVVVPIILANYSWQWNWWASAVFVLIAAVICWFSLVDTPAERGLARIGATNKQLSASSVEKESREPMASKVTIKEILKRGTVWNLGSLYLARGIGYVIFLTFAVAYLKEIGWGIKAAAGALAIWGVAHTPGPVIWGIAADRLTKKYLLAIALFLELIGMLIFLEGSTVGSYIGAAVVGFGTVGTPTVMSAAMADYCEPKAIGTTFGLITLLFGIGAMIGPTMGGALADATGTLLTTMLTGSGALILAIILALILKKPQPQPES